MAEPTCPFCKTPLDEHPANRCLDAWAEMLREKLSPGDYDAHPMWAMRKVRVASEEWYCIARFHSDIASAFGLFRILSESGAVRLSNGDGDTCDMDFLPFNGLVDVAVHIEAADYPEAITKAFIAAKEGDKP